MFTSADLTIYSFCCVFYSWLSLSSPGEVQFYDRDPSEAGEQYQDDTSETKQQVYQYEDKNIPQNSYSVGTAGHKLDDDQNSYYSGKEKHEGKGSDIDTQRYQDDQHDHYRGSRDRLDDKR